MIRNKSSKYTSPSKTAVDSSYAEFLHLMKFSRGWRAPWVVLLAGLSLSLWAWQASEKETRQRAQEQFEFRSQRIESAIRSRMLAYEHMLRGGVSLFLSSDGVDRSEWRLYVRNLNFNQHYPGVQGICFAKYIRPEEKDAHIEQVRAEGFPDYTIRPEGERPEYTSTLFLEPFDRRNRRAFGYDMFSDPVRREAMIRARDNGRVAMSGKVTLVQEDGEDVQAGFLIYLPLYRTPSVPVRLEDRRAALEGYVCSPFRMRNFMQGLLAEDREYVELAVFDGVEPHPDARLYQTEHSDADALFNFQTDFRFGEHSWCLVFHSSRFFEEHLDRNKATAILVLGLFISLLLANMVFLLARSRRQSAHLAEMADGLAAANSRLTAASEGRRKAETELLQRAEELDEFNAAMTGREARVIELKEEVNRLSRSLGRPQPYPPVWMPEEGA